MRKSINAPSRRYSKAWAPTLAKGMNSALDRRTLSFDTAEAAYNVCVEDGALKTGYGIAGTGIPSRYVKIYYYKTYDEQKEAYGGFLLGYDSQLCCVCALGEEEETVLAGAEFASPPLGINYRLYGEDVYLLCGSEGMAVVKSDLTVLRADGAPSITSIAEHNERMFVTIGGRRNAVWFSDDLDPTNWNPELDEGGFIELEGESGRLNKALSFGGYVYVFRDYGIARLVAYGDQSEFSVTNLFVSGDRIFGDTAAVCGDRILFAASDGMYAFDGVSASRIYKNLDAIVCGAQEAKACYIAGKYYLAAGDYVIVADPRGGGAAVCKDLEISSFSPVVSGTEEKLYVYVPGKDEIGEMKRMGTAYGLSVRKVWRSGFTDLGYPEYRKLVSEVYVDTDYDVTVTVSTERGKKTLAFKGGGPRKKRVNLVGRKVRMEIVSDVEISLARPTLRYAVIN